MYRSVLAAASLLLLAAGAAAREGDRDLRFSGDGDNTQSFDLSTSKYDEAVATLVDDQGRYVIVGNIGDNKVGMVRVLPDGSIDTAFGGGDGVADNTLPGNATVTAAAIDKFGQIVVVGYALNPLDYDPFVCRFWNNGYPDGTVSPSGCRVISVDYTTNGDDKAYAVTTDNLANIYIAGSVQRNDPGDYDFLVMKLVAADASLDPTFGANAGKTSVPFDLDSGHAGGDDDQARAIYLRGQYLFVGGYAKTNVFAGNDFAIAKVGTFSGTVDTTFCPDAANCAGSGIYQGKRTFSFETVDASSRFMEQIEAITVLSTGAIIVAGEANNNASPAATDVIVTKLAPNGDLFIGLSGNMGNHERMAYYAESKLAGLALRGDEKKIVIAGTGASSPGNALDPHRVLWAGQLNTNLSRDQEFASVNSTSFWLQEYVLPNFGGIQPVDHLGGHLTVDRGRILLTGSRLWQRDTGSGLNDFDFALIRLQGDAIFIDGLGDRE